MNITRKLISVNHRKGRRHPVLGIAIHVTEGTAGSVDEWFNDPAADASAHYMVRKDGGITQYVLEEDEAWAQGRKDNVTAQIVLDHPELNPNSFLISIEHEGSGREDIAGPQRAASIELIRDIATRHSFPIDRYHGIGHHEIYSKKSCPGAINVDRLVQDAKIPLVRNGYPRMVWSDFFHDYLVVTRVVSDTEWYFTPLAKVKGEIQAQTPLSSMKLNP